MIEYSFYKTIFVFLFKCIYRLNERACSNIRCLTDSLWRTTKSCIWSSLQKVFTKEFFIKRFQQKFRLKGARGILDTRPYLSLIKAICIYNVIFIFIVWPLLFPCDKGWKDMFKYLMLDRSNCRDSLKVGFFYLQRVFSTIMNCLLSKAKK